MVTGASRGIGLALARELASRGWHVLAGARRPSEARGLQAAAHDAKPGTIDIVALDVRSDESVRRAVEEAAGKVRALDALVNNAAVFPEEGNERLEDLPLALFEEAFSVNVVGVARVTRAFLPLLGAAAHPRVINISSLAGSIARKEDARHYCYSASKAALNMLTRTMAAELRPRGITVVAVTPGWVRTEMGGPQAPLTAEESARSLGRTIERISPQDAGHFCDRDGSTATVAW
jgi:NAD(P)-dependent dehydrogenase (short-subunit alcohol dehydrogenase family)